MDWERSLIVLHKSGLTSVRAFRETEEVAQSNMKFEPYYFLHCVCLSFYGS
jgi:hypothetical protein